MISCNMVIVTIRPWKNFNTSKQLIAIERKVVVQFGCLLESCIVYWPRACLISLLQFKCPQRSFYTNNYCWFSDKYWNVSIMYFGCIPNRFSQLSRTVLRAIPLVGLLFSLIPFQSQYYWCNRLKMWHMMVKLDHARRRPSHEKVSKWTQIENKHEKMWENYV